MNKWAISGILCCVIGGVMLMFQKLGGLMGNPPKDPLAIVDLVSPDSLNWIDGVTLWNLNNLLDTIVLAPLYIHLFIVGAVLLIISGFQK